MAQETPTAPTRARAAVGLLLLAGLAALLPWTVHPWYDPTNDGSMYIATARSLVRGEGYSYLGEPFLIRPPGFSCLIAPVLAARGTDFFALNFLVALSGVVGIVLLFLFLRERLGELLALLVALVVWSNPGFQRLSNQVMSDVPGLTATLACLLVDRRVRRSSSLRAEAALGILVALASYLRSGNLLLLPALVAVRLLERLRSTRAPEGARRTFARIAALGGVAALVLLPWAIRNRAVAPPPPADQTLLYSYSSGMWHEDMGDPSSRRLSVSEVLARLPIQSTKMAATLGNRLIDEQRGPSASVLTFILLGALLVVTLRRPDSAELFVLANVAVIIVYFGYAARLCLPVYVFALSALVELVRGGIGALAGKKAATLACALGLAACGALDFDWRAGWGDIERQHRAFQESSAQFSATLEATDRLGAYRGWHWSVYLDRPVWSFERAIERARSFTAVEEIIEEYELDAVLLSSLGLPGSEVPRAEELARYVAGRYAVPARGVVPVR